MRAWRLLKRLREFATDVQASSRHLVPRSMGGLCAIALSGESGRQSCASGAALRARAEAGEQALDDVAELPQQRAPAGEERPQQARHREHILPVRHRGKHVGFHPFAVREHPLLVAARTEITRLAREGEDEAVPAPFAVDPGEAVLRIAAGEESPDDVLLYAAAEAAARP